MSFLKIVRLILTCIVSLTVIIVSVLVILSPGKISVVKDRSNHRLRNGTVEKIFTDINGCRQGMFISSTSDENPVLLFVHGGPGMPEYFLNDIYPVGLEQYFTVCWWDQRGAGLSYSDSLNYKDITVAQNIRDLKKVTDFLKNKYHTDRIFLLAHSWGSFIGIQAVKAYPDDFYAYIGVGQDSDQQESEKRSYAYISDACRAQKDRKGLKELSEYADLNSDTDTLIRYSNSIFRDEAMHRLGIGTMRNMKSVITGIFIPSLFFRGYTVSEKINLWKGKAKMNKYSDLRKTQLTTDLRTQIKELAVPIVFISGKFDYTVNWQLAEEFCGSISDTDKKFIIFENSAHSPMFEERDRFLAEMIAVRNLYAKPHSGSSAS